MRHVLINVDITSIYKCIVQGLNNANIVLSLLSNLRGYSAYEILCNVLFVLCVPLLLDMVLTLRKGVNVVFMNSTHNTVR